jgi:CrcB protein
MLWLLVALGGASGAVSRYAVDKAVTTALGHPSLWGVFLINITGSFVLGLFISAADNHTSWPAGIRTLVAVGFLGSYTTFSTLTVATMQSAIIPDLPKAALNILGSIAVGLIAAMAGIIAGRAL